MSLLVSPASYVALTDFKTMPLDYDLTSYTDAQLTDILVSASGDADAIMKKSVLAAEITRRFWGDNTDTIYLEEKPLLYLRKIQFFQPGSAGYVIPIQNIMVDQRKGVLTQYAPIQFVGIGTFSEFPEGIAVDVTYGRGYGFNPFAAPAWSAVDVPAGPGALTPGSYSIGVTTKTMFGETLPSVQTVNTATGAFLITATPALGAYEYRVFIAPVPVSGPTAALSLCAEIPAITYGSAPAQSTISSMSPPAGYYPETAPTLDSSAPTLPSKIREGVRLLAMQRIYEQNNLANRGISKTESGRKSTAWRSTEGNSGKGVPLYFEQATVLLAPSGLHSIF